jgi:adenosine kinase
VQVLETDGPQEWSWDRATALTRLGDAYGPEAAREIEQVFLT